jgi:DinB superfamily
MNAEIKESRKRLLELLASTRADTKALLQPLDPERVIHTDERAWRVRDILGHLGVWNWEAARSLRAHAQGGEYHCVPSEGAYYDYNGPAADDRRTWPIEQVWAEYESAHEALAYAVETMPEESWSGEMLYPWNERGTVPRLIEIMMKHESADHCRLVAEALG